MFFGYRQAGAGSVILIPVVKALEDNEYLIKEFRVNTYSIVFNTDLPTII